MMSNGNSCKIFQISNQENDLENIVDNASVMVVTHK